MNVQNEIDNWRAELAFKLPRVFAWDRCGSSLFHPLAQDVDFVVLVEDVVQWSLAAEAAGWSFCSANPWKYMDGWQALRLGHMNVMVTSDETWYADTIMAGKVCQAARLFNKEDRIRVMRVIRERLDPEDARDYRKARGL